MFGFIKKNKCFYCDAEMPLLSDTCAYCGQKQKTDPFATTHPLGDKFKRDLHAKTTLLSQTATTPQPKLQTQTSPRKKIVPQVTYQTAPHQTSHPTPTQKQKNSASLRFVFFLAWLALFRDFIMHYMEGQPYGSVNWEFYGGGLAAALFLFFLSSARSLFLSFFSAILMSLSGFVLLLKPKISPHESSWLTANGDMERYIFSYTSETHLYYVIPGLILAFLAFIIFFSNVTRLLGRIRERFLSS